MFLELFIILLLIIKIIIILVLVKVHQILNVQNVPYKISNVAK